MAASRDFWRGVAVGLGGATAAIGVVALVRRLLAARATSGEGGDAGSSTTAASTTSSAHGGAVYESSKAVAEYLQFHFGRGSEILPYAGGPHEALDFASRTAAIAVQWCRETSLRPEAALDVGCAVGRTAFDLTATFPRVVGIDYSHAFIAAANSLKATGVAEYTYAVEGEITDRGVARLPDTAVPARVTFMQGDACALPPTAALGGPFSVVHAANLLCRLPDPQKFLDRLPSLVVPRGLVVFISPYSWLPQYTARSKWLGGFTDGEGRRHLSADGLRSAMAALGFSLLHMEDCAFLIREHARKYQWGCSHVTVFQRVA